jgi:hypothetical protein
VGTRWVSWENKEKTSQDVSKNRMCALVTHGVSVFGMPHKFLHSIIILPPNMLNVSVQHFTFNLIPETHGTNEKMLVINMGFLLSNFVTLKFW